MRRSWLAAAILACAALAGALAFALPKDGGPTYLYEKTGLSFDHDPDLSVYPLSQQGTDYLVLRKNPDSRGYYQVAVSPFDGSPDDLSLSLLRERNPGAPMEEVGEVSLPIGDALAVEVGDAPWKTYELWLVRDGFIYQFLADSSLSSELRAMAESARFDNAAAPR